MRLAVIDRDDKVLISWPSVAEAHEDLAALLAANYEHKRWQSPKKRKQDLEQAIREHLLVLQRELHSV